MREHVIFIVLGKDARLQQLIHRLRSRGYTVASYRDVRDLGKTGGVSLIEIADLRSDEVDRVIRESQRQTEGSIVFVVTSRGSEDLAVTSFRAGASDYFNQHVPVEEMVGAVETRTCAARFAAEREGTRISMPELVGRSPAIDAVRTFVAQAARTEANVLITGETGTGKEHVARLIHGHSSRRTKPLAIINCAAIPDGLLESELFGYERGAFTGAGSRYEGRLRSAHAGTTFLDEIGDMSLAGQAKLLRVIETKEIQRLGRAGVITADIRIIAATNGDLERMIVEGKFRADLYYRLAVARVRLPALRERPEDIAVLAQHYVDHYSRQFGRHGVTFTPAVLRVLWRYTWPGNVRELRNIVEAVFVAGPPQAIDSADLPSWFPQHLPHGDRSCAEREALLLALSATKSNKSKAAQHLNVSRMTLYRRLAKYQLTSQSKNEASR